MFIHIHIQGIVLQFSRTKPCCYSHKFKHAKAIFQIQSKLKIFHKLSSWQPVSVRQKQPMRAAWLLFLLLCTLMLIAFYILSFGTYMLYSKQYKLFLNYFLNKFSLCGWSNLYHCFTLCTTESKYALLVFFIISITKRFWLGIEALNCLAEL